MRNDPARRFLVLQRGEHQVLVNLSDRAVEAEAYGKLLLSWEPGVRLGDGVVEVPPRSAVVMAP